MTMKAEIKQWRKRRNALDKEAGAQINSLNVPMPTQNAKQVPWGLGLGMRISLISFFGNLRCVFDWPAFSYSSSLDAWISIHDRLGDRPIYIHFLPLSIVYIYVCMENTSIWRNRRQPASSHGLQAWLFQAYQRNPVRTVYSFDNPSG